MQTFSFSFLLSIAGIALIILELALGAATGFDLLLLGGSLFIGGTAGMIMNSWQVGLASSVIASIISMVYGRKIMRKSLGFPTEHTNVDQLIQKTGVVTKTIHEHKPGMVKVGSELWRAESSSTIEEGSKVTVISVEGVTLRVESVKA